MPFNGKKRKKKKKHSQNKKPDSQLTYSEVDLSSLSGDTTSSTDQLESMEDLNEIIQQADSNLTQLQTKSTPAKQYNIAKLAPENNFRGFSTKKTGSSSTVEGKQKHTTASKNKQNNIQKDTSRDDFHSVPEYIRFLYVQSTDATVNLRRISPFGLKKGIELITDGPIKSARFCRSGSLLVETFSYNQTKKLALATSLINNTIKIEVTLAFNINTTQGTIYAPELENLSNEEIADGLSTQNVISARRILKSREKSPTHIIVLTFGLLDIPQQIFCGYLSHRVRQYYPNPLRCFVCQRFGHRGKFCKGAVKCGFCSQPHLTENCERNMQAKCVNCSDIHPSYSRECSHYVRENEIVHLKVDNKTTFDNARKLFNTIHKNYPNMDNTYAETLQQKEQGISNHPEYLQKQDHMQPQACEQSHPNNMQIKRVQKIEETPNPPENLQKQDLLRSQTCEQNLLDITQIERLFGGLGTIYQSNLPLEELSLSLFDLLTNLKICKVPFTRENSCNYIFGQSSQDNGR